MNEMIQFCEILVWLNQESKFQLRSVIETSNIKNAGFVTSAAWPPNIIKTYQNVQKKALQKINDSLGPQKTTGGLNMFKPYMYNYMFFYILFFSCFFFLIQCSQNVGFWGGPS